MSHHTPLSYQPCKIPLRRAMGVFGGINLTVHAGIYEDVLEADRRWKALGGTDFFVIRASDTGSYNCRPSAGHSRAVAIDFNWNSNPMGPKKTPCPQQRGFRAFYEKCWQPLGYGWGGNWSSKCDAMHITKLVSEGGDGVLWRKWPVQEEDFLAKLTEAEQQELLAKVRRIDTALIEKSAAKVKAVTGRSTGSVMSGVYQIKEKLDAHTEPTDPDGT